MTEETSNKQPLWRSALGLAATAIVGAVTAIGGMFLQDRFDVLGTQRDLVSSYVGQAEDSAASVDAVVEAIFQDLSNPQLPLAEERVNALRSAMLAHRRSAERVAVQIGSTEGAFDLYSRSMADLVIVAQRTEGAHDADDLIEAIGMFYATRRLFEEEVASLFQPISG